MEDDYEDLKYIIPSAKQDLCRLCLGSENVSVYIGQLVDKIHYCTSLVVRKQS